MAAAMVIIVLVVYLTLLIVVVVCRMLAKSIREVSKWDRRNGYVDVPRGRKLH